MGVYRRPDSPFWWLWLDGARQRVNTKIPLDGGSPEQNKELRRQAQVLYAARMVALARARHQLPVESPRRSFADHRVWYATNVSAHKGGRTREVSMLKQLGAFFDRYELGQIDHALAREWRSVRVQQVSPSTVRREEALLKHVLTTAVPKYLERNPLTGLSRLRVQTPDTRILTRDEETRLLRAVQAPIDRALVLCALDTLLRLSNVRTLTWAQDHRAYLFANTKVGPVKVPISARLRQALDALPTEGPYVFPPYAIGSNNDTIRMFREALEHAHIPTGRQTGGVSFHTLRHTGASRMLDAGVDVKTVMEIGGWKNLKVLERYLHPSEDRKREAVNAIGPPLTSRSRRRRESRKQAQNRVR